MAAAAALQAINAQLSGSKLVWGAAAVLVSMGSRFVIGDITPAQQSALTSPAARRIVVFCMIFLPTRDVLMSACMTAVFFVIIDGLANERSRYCVLPDCLKSRQPRLHPALPVAHQALGMVATASIRSGRGQAAPREGQTPLPADDDNPMDIYM